MDARRESEPTPMKNRTTVERKSERELVVTRTFNGPARYRVRGSTKPELLKQWWAPKSFGISVISCEADVRTGGTYRFVFGHPASEQPMEFFGRYIEVTPHSRLLWTNDEGGEGGAVTTVTFEERGAETLVVMHELSSSKEALDGKIARISRAGEARRSRNWTSFLSLSARAGEGHEVAELEDPDKKQLTSEMTLRKLLQRVIQILLYDF